MNGTLGGLHFSGVQEERKRGPERRAEPADGRELPLHKVAGPRPPRRLSPLRGPGARPPGGPGGHTCPRARRRAQRRTSLPRAALASLRPPGPPPLDAPHSPPPAQAPSDSPHCRCRAGARAGGAAGAWALAGAPAPGAAAPRLAGLRRAAGAHLLAAASGPLAAGQRGGGA